VFTDVILKEKESPYIYHIGMFLYLIQVKAVLFTIISAISNHVVVSSKHKGRYSVLKVVQA